jgi:hypothetical protein
MGGKSSAPPPDYSAMAAATQRGVDVAQQLGTRQMDFAQQQYNETKPYLQRIADTQIAAQNQQMQQAQDYYNYQQSTFRPLEQGLVSDAAKFSTEGYREGLARDAAAAAGDAFSNIQASSARAAAARGVNPNSGAGLALATQANLGLSAQRANAMTGARQQAEQMGWARRMDAAGLGRGLSSASLGAYQGATGAGTAGANTFMGAGNQYGQAFGQGAGYAMQGAQMGIGGAGNILNAQTSVYNTAQSKADPFASIVGIGLGGWASGGFKGL